MSKPFKISFLITHYNRPLDLLECIKAIRLINYSNYEIVVSDDFSSIENLIIIKNYPVDVIKYSKQNEGLAANINKGLKACSGDFILYCQEDFLLKENIKNILDECFFLINEGKLDMIRFISSCSFKKLSNISNNITKIPKFSIQNFLYNHNQYSDNPFLTTKNFYDKYGYYLEKTSGDYGESEYALRIFKSDAKIGLTKNIYVDYASDSNSVIDRKKNKKIVLLKKKQLKVLRAIRMLLEYVFYDKNRRHLLTYKNLRN